MNRNILYTIFIIVFIFLNLFNLIIDFHIIYVYIFSLLFIMFWFSLKKNVNINPLLFKVGFICFFWSIIFTDILILHNFILINIYAIYVF